MRPKKLTAGLTLVEVMVAAALFLTLTSGLVALTQLSVRSSQAAKVRSVAGQVLNETMEATLAVRASNFSNLREGSFYPQLASGRWSLVPGQEQVGTVRRWVEISRVQRELSCAGQRVCPIVESGGVVDPVTFRAKVFIQWEETGVSRQDSLETILTFWR